MLSQSTQASYRQAPVIVLATKDRLSLYITAVSAYKDAQRLAGFI